MSGAEINAGISAALKRRGMTVHHHSPTSELIFDGLSEDGEEALYGAMKRYSVRLLMRDVIKHQDGFSVEMLGGFSSGEAKAREIGLLVELGIVEGAGDLFRLAKRPVRSFGATLEWFTARVMGLEFSSPSIWGVTFSGAKSGGDFDVVSFFEGELIYIEVKSSPPKGIEVGEVAGFLNRVNALLPRAAIFFVDTHLRMTDRVVLLFHQEFLESMKDPFPKRLDIQNLEREIFHIGHRIFICNASRDLVSNFTVCLRDFLARGLSVL
ncbi:MAG: hypothetical protein JW984_08650 [Deltaproteobacteria bacterium]|uniref:Uncharacterized protein n=1 Tax=Candidatus Zymogenus saltonus TaxID=2844893 RepID=A0A9D8KEY2_9DELT|nr:hypothetical protein [Candidatus Zymogenus saltonus]